MLRDPLRRQVRIMSWTPDEEMPDLATHARGRGSGRLWCALIGAVLSLALLTAMAFSAEPAPGVLPEVERVSTSTRSS
jgi:hypothetical protein